MWRHLVKFLPYRKQDVWTDGVGGSYSHRNWVLYTTWGHTLHYLRFLIQVLMADLFFPLILERWRHELFSPNPKKKLNPADASCAIGTSFASTHCAGTVDISRFPLIVPGHVTRPLNQSHNVYRGSRLSRQMSYVNSTQRSRGYILTLSLTLNMSQSAPSLVFCDITSHDVGGASDVMSTNMRSLPLIPANYKTL